MKMRIYTIIAMLAFIAGCAKDNTVSSSDTNPKQMTFKSVFVQEPDTRSYLEDRKDTDKAYKVVIWHAGDQISVVPADVSGAVSDKWYTFSTSYGGEVAEFKGEAAPAEKYVGVYPVASDDYLDAEAGIVYKNHCENQIANEGNLAKNQILAVAKESSDGNLYFYNACGLIKFTLPDGVENITKVAFRGNGGEKLAGRLGIKYSEGDYVSVWVNESYTDQESMFTLTLTNADGSALKAGGTYYLVSAPSKLEKGFTVAMYTSDGKRYAKSTVSENEIHRSKVMNLGTLKFDEALPEYDKMFLISEAAGWSFQPMVKSPVDPFTFRYGGYVGGGQFKFGTRDLGEGRWDNNYKALEKDNADWKSTDARFVASSEDDTKWLMPATAEGGDPCRIILDITPGVEKMYLSKFEDYVGIYLVGDAAPNGWNLGEATSMTKGSDFNWTWNGELEAGELKFSLDQQPDWKGKWLMAPSSGYNFENGDVVYVDSKTCSYDWKWKVAEAGNYTITINTLTEKMTVQKKESANESIPVE